MDSAILEASRRIMAEEDHDCENCSMTDECVTYYVVNNPEADNLEVMAKVSYTLCLDTQRISNNMGLMTMLSEKMGDHRLGDLICRASLVMAMFCLCMSELKEVILEKEGR